jgi:hypothetical protein
MFKIKILLFLGENLTVRLRKKAFAAMMNQETVLPIEEYFKLLLKKEVFTIAFSVLVLKWMKKKTSA